MNSQEFSTRIKQAIEVVEYDGLFWLSYPKKKGGVISDLLRDKVWELVQPTGLRPVTQIALDETWSALRFRPAKLVGK